MAGGKADRLCRRHRRPTPTRSRSSSPSPTPPSCTIMALNFAFVVPKEEVEKWGADFGHHPVGTGAFKIDRLDARPAASCSSATRTTTGRACPISTRSPSRSARSRLVALLRLQKGEVDVARRRHPAGQVPRGDGRSRADEGPRRRGRAAADRLRHHERQDEAVRQCAGAPGRQHGDQQGPHHQDHQRPRRSRRTSRCRPRMPGYDKDYKGYPYRSRQGQGAARRGRLSPTASTTELYATNTDPQPAHRPGDPAGSGGDRHQGRRSSRSTRPT